MTCERARSSLCGPRAVNEAFDRFIAELDRPTSPGVTVVTVRCSGAG